MAGFVLTTHVQIKELYNNTGITHPSQSTPIIDTFTGIVHSGNRIDSNVSTYVVQNLIPDKEYKLTFQLFKSITDGSGGTIWTNVLSSPGALTPNASMNPASVTSLATNANDPAAGGFWWSNQDPDRELRFRTTKNDGSSITGQNFGNVRQGLEFNTPSSDAGYKLFSGPKSFTLESNGKPAGGFATPTENAIPHTFDGYLFIFEKKTVGSDVNKHFTDRFLAVDFVGGRLADEVTVRGTEMGFLRISEINTRASGDSGFTVGFNEIWFTTDTEKFYYREGAGLDKTKEYQVALMMVNTTAKYIVKEDKLGSVGRVIKWFVADIPVGGVWSITLGGFQIVSTSVSGQLSDATSVAVSVDSIGVAGSITNTETFKIIITAEPV
jgi:hypothetical protein